MSDELDERQDDFDGSFEAEGEQSNEKSICVTFSNTQSSYKKKQRGIKRKTCSYVDYDQEVDQEDVVQMAAALAWSGSTSHLPPEKNACGRESVTYDDIAPQPVSARKIQHFTANCQSASQQVNYHQPYRQPMPLPVNQSVMHPNLMNYCDPNVTASEKRPIFKKPNIGSETNSVEAQKPRRKRKKKTQYWEQRCQREAMEQERKKNQPKKPPVLCRFYTNGNCKKGDTCTFSHAGEQRKKDELCRYYVKGNCTKGSECPFIHGSWPCKFFHKFGSCLNGDVCKFSHEPLTDETRLFLQKSIFDITGQPGEGNSQPNGDSNEASAVCGERNPDISLNQRLTSVKPYKLDAIEFESAPSERILSAIDSVVVSSPLRFAEDPRTTRGQISSATLEPRGTFEVTPFTRLIPFADVDDDNCLTELYPKVVNGCAGYEESDKLVIVEDASPESGATAPPVPDASHVVAADGDTGAKRLTSIVGARHFMHHNVDWMCSARSGVRLKSSSTPSVTVVRHDT